MKLVVAAPERFGETSALAFNSAVAAYSRPVVGLATGNSPVPLYSSLARMVRRGETSLQHFGTVFAIDEYVVEDADHPCANRAFFTRHWQSIPGPPPVRQFDVLAPDLTLQAERFSRDLAAAGGLDLVVLGIGLNGHLAFNEPGSIPTGTARLVPLTAETRASASVCFGSNPPEFGLTLGLSEILGAGQVLLLASGSHKAKVIAHALHGPISSECPASYLQQHPALTVVLDTAAAELMEL